MKILKLHLKAFGPFTNASLDLSQGQHGLHIVYGPNEAGKSSTLRAITNLLFGFPSRTPDNFIHPYPKLRVGAEIQHSDGSILEIVRKKASKNSLLDIHETESLEDEWVDRFLADVDRDLFRMMFGIDHQRLREGGEAIINGEGRIGELLFSAGAGITDLHAVQRQLNDEVELLLKSSGRSGAIIDDLKAYKETQQAMEKSLVTAETWKQHDQNLQAARKQKDRLDERIRATQTQRNRLIRIKDATSAISQWKKTKNDLKRVAHVPLLPENFESEANDLLFALRNSEQRISEAKKTIERLTGEIASIQIPAVLLQEATTTDAIHQRLGGYRKANTDRPKLETKFKAAENDALEILKELGRTPDLSTIEELRLPNDQTVRIQNLGNQQEALVARVRSLRLDCQKTRDSIAQLETEIANSQKLPNGQHLSHRIQEIQSGGDWDAQLQTLQKEIRELEQNAAVKLEQLGLWSGELQVLEKLAVPTSQTIERFANEFNSKSAEITTAATRAREKGEEKSSLEHELATLELAQNVPTLEDLQRMRELRDAGWKLVCETWNKKTEQQQATEDFCRHFPGTDSLIAAYRRSVENADQIGDQLRQDADIVVKKSGLQLQIDQSEINLQNLNANLKTLHRDMEALENRWRECWAPLEIAPLRPLDMRDWLHRQERLVEMSKELRAKLDQERTLRERIEVMQTDLRAAIHEIDPESLRQEYSLNELLRIGAGKIDEIRKAQNQLEQLNHTLGNQREHLSRTDAEFVEAEQELGKWQTRWATEMDSLGLADDALPAQANSVLNDIGRLFQKFRDADQMRIRLDGIARDAREFETNVNELIRKALPEMSPSSAEDAVSMLTSRLTQARSDHEKQESLTGQKEEQQKKLVAAENAVKDASLSLEKMCLKASCDSFDQLSEVAIQSRRRRELEKTVDSLEESISGQSGGMEFETFLREVESEALDFDSMQPKIDELESQINELNRERDGSIGRISEEKKELEKIDGGSKASQLSLKCESISASLEEKVNEFAALRLAAVVLHKAMEEYREKNQGPILSRASDIFQRLTLNAFSRLQADFNESGEPVLKGMRNGSDERVAVDEMSDGTCDQLYLALRLASIENWLRNHEAVPFIIDDVLLNFDDDRAVACLKVLAELSKQTQVIFFTHHQHLAEIARESLAPEDLFVTTLINGE